MNKPIHTIRYMGNKSRLLDLIVPEILKNVKKGEFVCDLMAGTSTISYALADTNPVISNDIQYYSYVLSSCFLKTKTLPRINDIHSDIDEAFDKNMKEKNYRFFVDNYSDTYFSREQCLEIDSLRYAIERCQKEKQNYYLVLLMSAMCKAQSTTGHFAQFLSKDTGRVQILRKMSIKNIFYETIHRFDDFNPSRYENSCYNLDYKKLFKEIDLSKVKCFYLDSPYTHDQYSRFYHVLETICKYDAPKLLYKAKYRNDRPTSDFCYNSTVKDEFKRIMEFASKNKSSLVISYSNHGILPIEDLKNLANEHFGYVEVVEAKYKHSSQGDAPLAIIEYVINCHS